MGIVRGETPAKLNRVDSEPLENVFIDDRQLLNLVVHADRLRFQTKVLAQLRIGDCGDSG